MSTLRLSLPLSAAARQYLIDVILDATNVTDADQRAFISLNTLNTTTDWQLLRHAAGLRGASRRFRKTLN